MHRVLQIPEVLLNIFCRCVPSNFSEEERKSTNRDLATLARTCRAFKEPALDILWSELHDTSPLSRCLPEISIQTVCGNFGVYNSPVFYSFTRPLERVEWDILCSYARRVWYMHDYQMKLDWKSLRPSMDFQTPPLFQNIRTLLCEFGKETTPLLQLPFPSLIRLDIRLARKVDLHMLQDPLMSLAKTSPNIKKLDIWSFERDVAFPKIISDGVCGWSRLQSLSCPETPFDVDTLVHLSRMPTLIRLTFALSGTFPTQTIPSDSLSFATLNSLKLCATSLTPISRLLSWVRLPSVIDFTVAIDSLCPTKHDVASFMASIQEAGMGHTVQKFNLDQVHDAPDSVPPREPDAPLLDLDSLRPCMAFHNIRHMNINLQWDVGLSDDQLLTLVSAWPQIEELHINVDWGWNGPGITPNGLASLLQTYPFLTSIALAIDTRRYTQSPNRRFREPANVFARRFHLNVLDSDIAEESMDAMADFLASIVPHFDFILTAWETWAIVDFSLSDLYRERWEEVYSWANDAVKLPWLLRERFAAPESII